MKTDKPIQYEIYRKGDYLLFYLFLYRGFLQRELFHTPLLKSIGVFNLYS